MTIHSSHLLKAAMIVAKEEQLYVTTAYGAVAGITTLITASVGSVVLGPVGAAAGCSVGGLVTYILTKDKYKSLPDILQELSPEKREALIKSLREGLKDVSPSDLIAIYRCCVYDKTPVVKKIMYVLQEFAMKELGKKLVEHKKPINDK